MNHANEQGRLSFVHQFPLLQKPDSRRAVSSFGLGVVMLSGCSSNHACPNKNAKAKAFGHPFHALLVCSIA